jgi:ABC-type hemin transport system ATPase subunit
MIEARGLSKRYGGKVAVDELTFTVPPGRVTGFLGPNGAGKPDTGLRHSWPACQPDCRHLVRDHLLGRARRPRPTASAGRVRAAEHARTA